MSSGYQKQAQASSQQRLAWAGYRLSALLDDIYKDKDQSGFQLSVRNAGERQVEKFFLLKKRELWKYAPPGSSRGLNKQGRQPVPT